MILWRDAFQVRSESVDRPNRQVHPYTSYLLKIVKHLLNISQKELQSQQLLQTAKV